MELEEELKKQEDVNYGKISKILCMIAAIGIATIPETMWSSIIWVIYSIGAITGIIHLRRRNDKDTMQMYIIWLVLDVYAFVRLVFKLP